MRYVCATIYWIDDLLEDLLEMKKACIRIFLYSVFGLLILLLHPLALVGAILCYFLFLLVFTF